MLNIVSPAHTLIVLGSGLSSCFTSEELDVLSEDSADVVVGHSGKLAQLRSAPVLVSLGRRHLYEGCSIEQVTQTVRTAAAYGVRNLIISNAAGGINPRFDVGDIMLITDHIGSLLGRWISRTSLQRQRHTYASELYPEIESRAMASGVALRSGVYAGVLGPSYETRAEIRMLRRMGADAVGMSTVHEVIAAAQASMRVIGLSLVTNTVSDTQRVSLDHADVVRQGNASRTLMRVAINAALETLDAM